MRLINNLTLLVIIALTSGCGAVSNVFNPFYEPPSDIAYTGDRNDHALSGKEENVDKARGALEAMASYQRAHAPQPVHPVLQPAVIRLMWIPDHLNRNGDLVPAHYYYLKVLQDRFAVTDAFELESQLNGPKGSAFESSSIPFVTEDTDAQ